MILRQLCFGTVLTRRTGVVHYATGQCTSYTQSHHPNSQMYAARLLRVSLPWTCFLPLSQTGTHSETPLPTRSVCESAVTATKRLWSMVDHLPPPPARFSWFRETVGYDGVRRNVARELDDALRALPRQHVRSTAEPAADRPLVADLGYYMRIVVPE